MSWSVSATGTPAGVKVYLVKQFENARKSTESIPHEHASVGLVEKIVNDQLDFLADISNAIVTVNANGSAYKQASSDGPRGSSSIYVSVSPVHGWVG